MRRHNTEAATAGGLTKWRNRLSRWLRTASRDKVRPTRRRLFQESLEDRRLLVADLIPFAFSGWPDSIVISTVTGTNTDAAFISTSDTVRVDVGMLNRGSVTTGGYNMTIQLDSNTPAGGSLPATVPGSGFLFSDINFGSLSAGDHTLTLTIDSANTVVETNESNNVAVRRFVVGSVDFGDAPTATQSLFASSYPTAIEDSGARHTIVSGFSLGASVDAELMPFPSVTALRDDSRTTDDDNGVTFRGPLAQDQAATIDVFVTNSAGLANPRLDAWIDFNRDGDWLDAGETIYSGAVVAGNNAINFQTPLGASLGATYARFRLSTNGSALTPSGSAANGEVEDHLVVITAAPEVWQEQGGGSTQNGQVEEMQPSGQVAGATHVVLPHPSNADILYAGTVNGGIWKTTNATATNPVWTPQTDALGSLSIGAMAFDPTDGTNNTLVAGTANYSSFASAGGSRGLIYRTTNGGATWTELASTGLKALGENISGIAVRGSTIVVTSSASAGGIFRSIDGGATFSPVSSADFTSPGPNFTDMVVDRSDATGQRLYAASESFGGVNGIYRSDNFGSSWTKISTAAINAGLNTVLNSSNNVELAVHPTTGRLYAGILIDGQLSAVYYTGNGTAGSPTWTQMDVPVLPLAAGVAITGATNASPIVITSNNHGLSGGEFVVIAGVNGNTAANGFFRVTVVDANTFRLDGSAGNGAYTSGGTWTLVTGPNPSTNDGDEVALEAPGGQGTTHFSIAVDPANENLVYIGGDRQDIPNPIGDNSFGAALFRGNAAVARNSSVAPSPQWDHLTHDQVSLDPAGGTRSGSAPHADSREMAFDANGHLLESDDGGIYRRTSPQNNTGDWVSVAGTISTFEYHDVAYDSNSNVLIAGSQDNGTHFQQADGSKVWSFLQGGDGGDVVVDPTSLGGGRSLRYSSSQDLGGFIRTEWDANNNLVSVTNVPLTFSGTGTALVTGNNGNAQFKTPVEINRIDPQRLLIIGAIEIYESTNRGNNITNVGVGQGGGGFLQDAVAYGGMSGGTPNPDVFYLGSGDDIKIRTTAGGAVTTVDPTAANTRMIRDVIMHADTWQTAYAINDVQVFRTTNSGGAWSDVTGDLLTVSNAQFYSLEFIPGAIGAVVVGTSKGVFSAPANNLANWTKVGANLPNALAYDLKYDPVDDVLVVGTMGRGAWTLPNASDVLGGDVTAPTVDIVDVSPDPRATAVGAVAINFTEPVYGFGLNDLSLTRNGSPVSLTGLSVTQVSQSQYTIDLSTVSSPVGTYVLTVTAAGSNIQDLGGNLLAANGSDTWLVDLGGPTIIDVIDVTPDPRNSSIASIDVQFSEALTLATLTAADFTLTRDGGANLLTGSETTALVSGTTYRLSGLSGLTATAGVYTLTVSAVNVQDAGGNPGTGSASDTWTVETTAPTVTDVVNVAPDPRTNSVTSIDVVLSELVVLASFTAADFSLTRDGGANLLTGSEVVSFVSGTTYRISGLSGLTGVDGVYTLTVTMSGVQDLAGNSGTGSASDTWTKDAVGPTVTDIVDVTPDPRGTSVATIDAVLSELVALASLTAADFTLTRDGGANLLTGSETVTLVSGTTYRLSGLTGLTGAAGAYTLTLNMSGVQDLAGNVGTGSANDSWTVDATAPTVTDVVDVSPDPRNTSVATIDVMLSELVALASLTAADFSLTQDGGANLLTGSEAVSLVSGTTYRLSGLTALTGTAGVYTLTLTMSGVQDLAGNSGTGSASDTWTVDTTAPTVTDVVDVTPDPRSTSIASIDVVLSEQVALASLTSADFSLTRDGGANLLTGAQTVALVSGTTYRLSGLTGLTGTAGDYTLTLTMSGVQDVAGNNGTGSASDTWTVDTTAPTVTDVVDVSPDPRNNSISSIDVVLSETILLATLTAADFSLTRDGGANLLTGSEAVTFVSGTTYRLSGLSGLTGTTGAYTLTLSMSGVTDAAGNAGTGSASDTWTVDATGPAVTDVVDVAPDPRNNSVASINVVLSEPIVLATLTAADFTLTRDGGANLLTGAETVSLVAGTTYQISGLAAQTGTAGVYTLTLNMSGVQDLAGNAGSGSASDSWTVETTAPTVTDVVDVTPDPRNSSVASIDVVLSETIALATLTAADFSLTRDGGANLLTGSETVTLVSGTTYRLSGLAGLTGVAGAYTVTLTMSGVQDLAGNSGTGSAADSWTVETTAPTVTDVVDVTPDPRNSSITSIDVVLSETITLATLTAADFSLTRNGGANLLTGSETVTLISGTTYRLNGLAGLTGIAGAYTVTLTMSGVQDLAGNSGTGSAADSWTVETTAPTVTDVVDVSPDPRNNSVASIDVVLSEPITLATLTAADFSLTRNGGANLLTGSEAVTLVSGTTYRLSGLAGLTGPDGAYTVTLAMSGVQDLAGNNGTGSASDSWTVDTTGPTVTDVVDVSPDPRGTAVSSIDVVLSEAVTLATLTAADFSLTRDGGANLLTGSETVTFVSGTTYRLNGLTGLTGVAGTYTLTASMSAVQDLAGNSGTGSASDTWTFDASSPTVVDVIDVSPDPRNTAVASIDVVLSEAITLATLTAADFTLTRNGGANLLTGSEAVTFVSGTTYRLSGLAGLTAAEGAYTLTLTMSGVQDTGGNAGLGSGSDSWVVDTTAPAVTDVVDVTPDPRNTSVASIDVVFSEAINIATLTAADFTLTRDGGANLLTGGESVALVSGSTYRLSGLASLTSSPGVYTLTAQGTGVQDAAGNTGSSSASDTWTFAGAGPVVQDVVDVAPDPRNTAVASIDVVFDMPVNLATLTSADFTLTRDGGANLLTGTETVALVSGSTYRLSGLSALTAVAGTYVLSIDGSGVQDTLGTAGSGTATDTWTVDTTAPTVTDVSDVTPDPRNTAVASIEVVLSEPIALATLTAADFTLTRNGGANLLTGSETVALVSGSTYRLSGLAGLTAANGAYVVTLTMSGVQDEAGNAGTGSANDAWTVDTTAPSVTDVVDVSPDPRNTAVTSIDVVLSEPILLASLTASDFTLTRNGGSNLLTGAESVTLVAGSTYRLSGLSGLTGVDGNYVLSLNMAGVQDPAGNSGAGSASDSWTVDTVSPSVTDVVDVTPDPRNSAVASIDVVFDSVIDLATLTAADFTLTRDGGANLLTGAETVTLVSGTTYRLAGLTSLTGVDGVYTVTAFGAGVQDAAGNSATGSAADTWTVTSALVTADIVDVTPDPRTNAVGLVTIQFSADVTGVDINDFTLTRNAASVSLIGLSVTQVTPAEYTIDLSTVTTLDGVYELTLVAAGSAIEDLSANPLAQDAVDSWLIDSVALTIVDIVDVSPDPRSTSVASIDVEFSEPVNLATLTAADFSLTRDGGSNLLTLAQSVTHVAGNTYRLSGLAGVTSLDGDYTLTLTMSGVTDVAGNAGVGVGNETWQKDSVGPTLLDVVDVVPDPRNTAVPWIEFLFNEPIDLATLTASAFKLTRNGGGNLLTGAETVTHIAGSLYRLQGLAGLTSADGSYMFTVFGGTVLDVVGNFGAVNSSDEWVMDTTAPTILDVIDVTPDPRTASVSAIEVQLSEPINLATFTADDFELRRNGGPNLLTGFETVSHVSGSLYRISGLAGLTSLDADYELSVSGAGIADSAGNAGTGSASDTWAMRAVRAGVTDVSGLEGNAGVTTFLFTVSLTGASTLPISINYATRGVTASSPGDFVHTTGTVTFAPGETSKTIFVPVVGDNVAEVSETFAIDLTNAVNVTLDDNLALGTILNDDAAFNLPVVEQLEGDSWATPMAFTFSLAFPSALPISFDYATADLTAWAGSDYQAASGTVTFVPGETSRTVHVLVTGDSTIEADEDFALNLSNVVNASLASPTVIGRILNDDGRVAVSPSALLEGNVGTQNMQFQISLDAAHAAPISVTYSTADGTATAGSDYVTTGGTVVFAPGERTKTVSVPILGDVAIEADETFTLEILSATGVAVRTGSAIGRIDNDDAFLSIGDASLIEGNSGVADMEFWVTLSSASPVSVSVDFATQAGSASFSDFNAVQGNLVFAPGEISKLVRVPIRGDSLPEQHETFSVVLSNSVNARIADGVGTGGIENDDVALRISDLATYEGNTGTRGFVFAVDLLGATANTVTVNYSTAGNSATAGVDYTTTSGSLTFSPGEVQKLVTVNVIGDTSTEPDETFFVNLAAATNAVIADSQGVGTILNDDNPSVTPTGVKDDGDWGYNQIGVWSNQTGAGYGGDHRTRTLGATNGVARWSLGVPTGRYEVFVTWVSSPARSATAPYTILDGTRPLGQASVNQRNAPAGIAFGGANWKSLGVFDFSVGSARVELASRTDGSVSADAVMLVPISGVFGSGEAPSAIAVDDWSEATASTWQNPWQSHDVNNDGFVTPLDALLLINDINLHGSRALPTAGELEQEAYLDPDGNGALEPRDVLMTIGHINGAVETSSAGEVAADDAAQDDAQAGASWTSLVGLTGSNANPSAAGREVYVVNPFDIAMANRWLRPTVGEPTAVSPESLDRVWTEWARGRYQLESADLTDLAFESLFGEV